MALSMNIPNTGEAAKTPEPMSAADRAQRLEAAQAVTIKAPYVTAAAKPAAKGARPWETVAQVATATVKQRVPLIMEASLRAKLDYLATQSNPKQSMSDIACDGMAAECLRIELANGLLMEDEAVKAQQGGRIERVLDNKHSALSGTTRTVIMAPSSLSERMKMLKDMKLVKTVSDLALAGIEDECNYRLKKMGAL